MTDRCATGKLPTIYVAETSCCGFKIDDPRDLARPAHWKPNEKFGQCHILRYFEYQASRQITRSEILKVKT